VLFLLALLLVLGIMTTTIQYKTVDDDRAINVKAATSIAISAWPIVFAAIVSQSLRTLATWSVERGIKLMVSGFIHDHHWYIELTNTLEARATD
jgi:hypothetical protein